MIKSHFLVSLSSLFFPWDGFVGRVACLGLGLCMWGLWGKDKSLLVQECDDMTRLLIRVFYV